MKYWVLIGLSLLLWSPLASASEQILSFHSDIAVQPNGDLMVTETIEVNAEGEQIERGIYRDFPTLYRDKLGNLTRVGFQLLSVARNGNPEPHQTKSLPNGVRIYLGDTNVMIGSGVHVYRIEYRSTRQIGFFDEFDELYWNVTGNDWSFPILMASANVTLPTPLSADQVNLTGYTGDTGSTDRFLTHRVVDQSNFHYETTHPLESRQGLTIVLNWPKGVIAQPAAKAQWERFVDDNQHSVTAVIGLGIVLFYYLLVWWRMGKDPESGVIMPLYQAPEGFSPASTRFISRMDYDKTCFTTALVNLAIKGAIEIEQGDGKHFLLRQTQNPFEASAGEQTIMSILFKGSTEVKLEREQHRVLGTALRKHEASLRKDYEKLYFLTNQKFFTPGIVLSLIIVAVSFIQMGHEAVIFSTLFVAGFMLIPFLILYMMYERYTRRRRRLPLPAMVIQLAIAGVFFSIAGSTLADFMAELSLVSWPVLISTYLLLGSNFLFEQWLKAPTLAGRKLLDQIEGLKLYLGVAEADELALQGKPAMSTDVYQRFLPFAIALGVENVWSQQLDRAVASGLVAPDFTPRGFRHFHGYHSHSDFADGLTGGFNNAVSSASTPPGSSSGSSGGSSGGGGGGGGGGGW
jgi:uncharacterized membrane protein YgcG